MSDIETITNQGDIQFVRGEGVVVSFRELDSNGDVVEPATHPRYLQILALEYDELIPEDLDDANYYRIGLTVSDVARIGPSGVAFTVLDKQGTIPIAVWSGVIRERRILT